MRLALLRPRRRQATAQQAPALLPDSPRWFKLFTLLPPRDLSPKGASCWQLQL